MSIGIASHCVQIMIRHGQERLNFGQPINRFGQIQRYIAEGYAMTETAQASSTTSLGTSDPANETELGPMQRNSSHPVGKIVADYAMQVMGVRYCREYPVERLWRDAKLEIGGSTLEAHQKIYKDLSRALFSVQ